MLDLLACNPWRPVDAWWQRAVGFDDCNGPWPTGRRDTYRGNGWIRQAHRYRHALSETKTYQDKMQVIADYPAIYYAHWIFEHASTKDGSVRWAIEARILARQTNEEIAQKNGCWPETIEAYEALFFNVRDRLNNRDFIFTSVLKSTLASGVEKQQDGYLWKLFGYLGGPHVLDAVISQIPAAAWVCSRDGVSAFFHDLAINSMKLKAALTSIMIPVEATSHRHLIESFVNFVEVERTTDSHEATPDQIQENVQAMLASMPFPAANANILPAHDMSVVELRGDELLRAAVGLEVPEAETLAELEFPELTIKR